VLLWLTRASAGRGLAKFAVCTHVGDQKPVHVNLDTVQMIEPYNNGALIKFVGGAALIVQEAPEELAKSERQAPAAHPLVPSQTVQPADHVSQSPAPKEKRQGPLKINLGTGKWVDLETGQGGTDVASLSLYLQSLSEFEAARRVASITGLSMSAVTPATTMHRAPTEGERTESAAPESLLAVPVTKLGHRGERSDQTRSNRPASLVNG
jgi:hypothetical protein